MHSEKELIQRARTDPRVFGELYDLHYPKIFGYVFRITGDYAIACDITSETFLKAWMKIGSFQWKGNGLPLSGRIGMRLSREAEKAIRVAVLVAKDKQSPAVEPEHLMLSILKVDGRWGTLQIR